MVDNWDMGFDPAQYGESVAEILALDGHGARLMPLALGRCSSEAALARLQATTALRLFPEARGPEAAMAGLYLYFSCLEESHEIAQGIHTPDGSYWHGIMHRQEPDPGNAGYWFRRVGRHPVFRPLGEAAAEIGARHGVAVAESWDPFEFIDLCERARRQPGSKLEQAALEMQRAEWQLLFDACARPGR
jgi:hypothetical protein